MTLCIEKTAAVAALSILVILSAPGTSSPSEADSLAEAAWISLTSKSDLAGARRLTEKALALDPSNQRANEIAGIVAAMRDDDDEAFQRWNALLSSESINGEIYINRIANLDLSPEQREKLIDTYLRIIRNWTNKVAVAKAQSKLAELYLQKGNIRRALRIYNGSGKIREWMVIGAFNNDQNIGYEEAYPPEKEIDYSQRYRGKMWEIGWRPVSMFTIESDVSLSGIMRPNDYAVAYALTFIHSQEEKDIAIRGGIGGAVKIWLNDEPVLSDSHYRYLSDESVAIGAHLDEGWNKLILKVCTKDRAWAFGLRATTPDGDPIDDVTFSRDVQTYRPREEGSEAPTIYEGAYGHYRGLVKKEPGNELALYYLASALTQRQALPEAMEAYEKLINLNPRCALYRYLLGRVYLSEDKETKAVNMFRKAIELDTEFVAAYIQLIKYYYKRKWYTLAKKYADRALKLNPESATLHLYLSLIYFKKDWDLDSYFQDLKALKIRPFSAKALTYTGTDYASMKNYHEAEKCYLKALHADFTHSQARRKLIDIYTNKGNIREAISQYHDRLRLKPLSSTTYLKISDIYRNIKKYKKATMECRKAMAICAEDFRPHIALGDIAYLQGDKDRALSYWKESLKYKPDNLWLRNYISFLSPDENDPLQKYAKSDSDVEALIKDAPSSDSYPDADAIILLDHKIVQVNDDGSSISSYHHLAKILTLEGRKRYSEIKLPKAKHWEVEVARTIKSTGEVYEATAFQKGKISLPELDVSSIVEYKYKTYRYSGSWLEGAFSSIFYFQTDEPIHYSDYIVAVPKSKELKHFARGDKIEHTVGEIPGMNVHIWSGRDMPRIYPERYRPPLSNIASLVRVSTIGSWGDIAKWERSLLREQLKADAAIRRKVAELTEGKETALEKIHAIYNWVAKNIRYLFLDTGIFGIKPDSAVNTFANKYGDCKDKATLFITMLRVAGIRAEYAPILTRNKGTIIKEIPANQANHVINYVPPFPGYSEGMFLDTTFEYSPYNSPPWNDQGADTLLLTEKGYEFLRVPVLPPGANSRRLLLNVEIREDGSALTDVDNTSTGSLAAGDRKRYEKEGTRKEHLERSINAVAPGCRLISCSFSRIDDVDLPVRISYSFIHPNFATVSPESISFSPIYKLKMTRWYASKSTRRYDMKFSYKWSYDFEEVYDIPEGYELESMPQAAAITSDYADYSIDFVKEQNKIIVRKKMFFKVLEIARDDYDEFRKFCIACDQTEKQEIHLHLHSTSTSEVVSRGGK